MNTILSKFGKILSFVAAVLAVISGNASATDLRDWGKKYSASQRFVVLGEFNNEAVLDKETQLVWPRTWPNAGSEWNGVSRSCANAGIGGRKGWRLPYLHELASLLDPAVTPTGNGGTKLFRAANFNRRSFVSVQPQIAKSRPLGDIDAH